MTVLFLLKVAQKHLFFTRFMLYYYWQCVIYTSEAVCQAAVFLAV